MCPVCASNYRVEGDSIPRILPCFCTVCTGCIRGKLSKGTSLECPLCGVEHTGQNGIKNIQENRYISHVKKKVEGSPVKKKKTEGLAKECTKHSKIQSIFCNESGCKMPICLMCLKDEHKGHDFCDLQEVAEERCAAILDDVRSMKETLQKKKDDLLASQKIVAQNCQECTLEINDVTMNLKSEIDRRAASLVYDITEHKKKIDARVNKVLMNIDEKLDIVNEFEAFANTATIFEVKPNMLEELKHAKNQIQSRFSETINYTALTYKKCGDMPKHLSSLCGKLVHKTKEISSEMRKWASQEYGFTENAEVTEGEENATPAVTTTGSSQGDNKTNNISMIKDDDSNRKTEENIMQPEIADDEKLKRVTDLMGEVGPLKDSVGSAAKSLPSTITAKPEDVGKKAQCIQPLKNSGSSFPQLNDIVVGNKDGVCNGNTLIQTAEKMVIHNKPAWNSLVKQPKKDDASVRNHPMTNSTKIIQPTVNAKTKSPPEEIIHPLDLQWWAKLRKVKLQEVSTAKEGPL